ncbi:MAG: 4Fe-4S dicluster domain-containing protein, partial [Desulfurococcales archaeon]|nr:4Fe-4S dicluster domain-containing protein [Desulfurococcales archaeon]
LEGTPYYLMARRNSIFIVENCVSPGNTCFCGTMGTGPEAKEGFDIAYTVLDDGETVVFRPGSDVGVDLLSELSLEPAPTEVGVRYRELMRKAREKAVAPFETEDLPDLLDEALDPEVWKKVAEKCLGCANCNMVCPTCFCFDVIDEPELDGSSRRVRVWDGCHSYTYAEIAGGVNIRKDLWARYRHWVLHKFSYWVRQFGTMGCVGCGRCITWCPAGIDLREVVSEVIKEVRK